MKNIVDLIDQDPNINRIMTNYYKSLKNNVFNKWIKDFYKNVKKCKSFSKMIKKKSK